MDGQSTFWILNLLVDSKWGQSLRNASLVFYHFWSFLSVTATNNDSIFIRGELFGSCAMLTQNTRHLEQRIVDLMFIAVSCKPGVCRILLCSNWWWFNHKVTPCEPFSYLGLAAHWTATPLRTWSFSNCGVFEKWRVCCEGCSQSRWIKSVDGVMCCVVTLLLTTLSHGIAGMALSGHLWCSRLHVASKEVEFGLRMDSRMAVSATWWT